MVWNCCEVVHYAMSRHGMELYGMVWSVILYYIMAVMVNTRGIPSSHSRTGRS